LTIRFEYGAFTLRGDLIEIRTGTLAYVSQPAGPKTPCVFRNGQWMEAAGNHEFQMVNLDVFEYGGFLVLINKEKYRLRDMKLEIISDTGVHYWVRIPGLAPAPSVPVYLDLSKFRSGDGGDGAEFTPNLNSFARRIRQQATESNIHCWISRSRAPGFSRYAVAAQIQELFF
jgi:hypothetical protein